MSRRSVAWRRKVEQAGGIEKLYRILPKNTKGRGTWLRSGSHSLHGRVCTRVMKPQKVEMVTSWANRKK